MSWSKKTTPSYDEGSWAAAALFLLPFALAGAGFLVLEVLNRHGDEAAHRNCTAMVGDSLQRGTITAEAADGLFNACMRAWEAKTQPESKL